MIEVTLTNAGLDITNTVESDGDFGPVTHCRQDLSAQ